MDKDTRFVIIGAGAAGLTAAETLREKGYSNVLILEKEAFVGGKCRSVMHNGYSYELGAGIVAANNTTIMGLVEKYNIPISASVSGQSNLYDLETGDLCEDIFTLPEKISFVWQLLLRYHRLLRQYPEVQKPGLAQAEPELFDNFHHWAKVNGIDLVERNFERYFTGFGYGYWSEIPAAYSVKYNSWETFVSFFRGKIYSFDEGIQTLWQKIAQQHNVKYNTTLQQINRHGNGITIHTNTEQISADVLLLTCPLDECSSFMELSQTEQELFSKIKHVDYRTYLCALENFPQQTGFIPVNFMPAQKGHPVFWYKRYADTNIYTVYVLSDFSVSDQIIHQNLIDTVEKLGGRLVSIEKSVKWKYFPHVDTTEMQNGYYPKLEALQGVQNTYYAGELLNFSMVELTAAYAKDLVERFF